MGRDPEYLAFMRLVAEEVGRTGRPGVADERRALAAAMAALPRPAVFATEELTVPGADGPLAARLYRADDRRPAPVLVFLHGGGWYLGGVEEWDPIVRALVTASGVSFVSVAYRLAPEHPYPAGFRDAVAATGWLAAHAPELGLDPARIGVGGDSAGANLAAAVALHARDRVRRGDPLPAGPVPTARLSADRVPAARVPADRGSADRGSADRGSAGPALAAQVLAYGAFDLRAAPVPPVDPDGIDLRDGSGDAHLGRYLAGADPADPYLSPLLAADLSGLPPAVVLAAEYDRGRPQSEAYARRLTAAGVPVTYLPGTGLDHGFLAWGPFARRPAEALAEFGAAIRATLGGAPPAGGAPGGATPEGVLPGGEPRLGGVPGGGSPDG